jgi:predicted nuclease of restriction endonuclease-like (RecB) superfamily
MRGLNKEYRQWLISLKNNIYQQKLHASLQVNKSMLILYWYLGQQVDEKIIKLGWGAKAVKQLSLDLQKAFPDMKGFSERNLIYMQQFSVSYPNLLITQQPAAEIKKSTKTKVSTKALSSNKLITQQAAAEFDNKPYYFSNPQLASIPWGHHMLLLDKISSLDERLWYIEKTIENNWSRSVLQYQIDANLYARQHKVKKHSNFHLTLPKQQSDLANQILKDPYKFDFLQLGEKFTERDLEHALVNHIQEFILELGAGFAFVGRQFKLKIGRKEYFIDLLFYHLYLRCYIAIELKMEDFNFSHTGQMSGYLNILNESMRHKSDNPSMGIILCSSKDEVEVDFALRNITHPIGVSDYKFMKSLPKQIKDKIPTAKQLQDEVKKFLKKRTMAQ